MIVVDGPFDAFILKRLAADVSKAIEKHGCRRILNDLRDARLKGVLDTYQMPKVAAEAGVPRMCKRALVVREGSSDFDFLETVFSNQGHRVKKFTAFDDAKQWLLAD